MGSTLHWHRLSVGADCLPEYYKSDFLPMLIRIVLAGAFCTPSGGLMYIGQGRLRETAQAFFEQIPKGVAARIKAVAIDMTTSYELEINAHCLQAEIVYDLFHVVAIRPRGD